VTALSFTSMFLLRHCRTDFLKAEECLVLVMFPFSNTVSELKSSHVQICNFLHLSTVSSALWGGGGGMRSAPNPLT
jgi:hypothetical protein